MRYIVQSTPTQLKSAISSYLESIASHAGLVFRYKVGAFFLGVVRIGEQHALVTLRFLVKADAAGLNPSVS
jgi:hypothetical protein